MPTGPDLTGSIIRVDAAARGVNSIFAACTQIDAGTKQAWSAWYAGWQKWADTNKDVHSLQSGFPAISDQVVNYENEIKAWQQEANDLCGAQNPRPHHAGRDRGLEVIDLRNQQHSEVDCERSDRRARRPAHRRGDPDIPQT